MQPVSVQYLTCQSIADLLCRKFKNKFLELARFVLADLQGDNFGGKIDRGHREKLVQNAVFSEIKIASQQKPKNLQKPQKRKAQKS